MRHKIAANRNEIKQGIKLWNRENKDFLIREKLVEQNIFSPFSGVNVVALNFYRRNKIVASGIIKFLDKEIKDYVDNTQGWISLLTADSHCADHKDVIVESLKIIEEFLLMKGVRKIRFGGDPQNFLPGLPESNWDDYLGIFKEMGYQEGTIEFDLKQNIKDFSFEREIEEKNMLTLKRVYKTNEENLYNFLANNFPGRWLYEAQNIGRIPGGLRDYWLLKYSGKTIAFARTNTVESSYQGPNVNWAADLGESYCGIGPLGIAKDYRKRGWGLHLIAEIINNLAKEGYEEMVIDWTTLIDYYKKLGFKPYKKYLTLEKKV